VVHTDATPFLTASWQNLVMLNYEAAPDAVERFVPAGCEIDIWQGRTFVSIVAFQFLRTTIRGVVVPFHRDFLEVNLRLYVRRRAFDGWRRGVVFVKEIVPRRIIALVARAFYNENYVRLPMRCEIVEGTVGLRRLSYEWKHRGRWNRVGATVEGTPSVPPAASEEAFIAEHYWGYARQRKGATMEYRVEHAPWRVWRTSDAGLDCDVASLYPRELLPCLTGSPSSAFVAEGSTVIVHRGALLT
jgi:uncharacterized protein YqjF (DUF2071 family)